MGMASVRFHRPFSGHGLLETAQPHIKSMRMLFNRIDFIHCKPLPDLLKDRDPDEAYCFGRIGQVLAVYFPAGGDIELDVSSFKTEISVEWLDINSAKWISTKNVRDKSILKLRTRDKGHWTALIRGAE
jgi:hypothetical protein